jgi:hypothetical protein
MQYIPLGWISASGALGCYSYCLAAQAGRGRGSMRAQAQPCRPKQLFAAHECVARGLLGTSRQGLAGAQALQAMDWQLFSHSR